MKNKLALAALLIVLAGASLRAGTFANIAIDGNFSDWTTIPVLATDVAADGSPVDFLTLQAANDNDFLYLRFTLSAAADVNGFNGGPSIFIAIDNDNNTGTGFDIFGLGAIGSDVGYQNDFPFAQSSSTFNSGTIDNGGAGIAPFFTNTDSQEIRISRAATFTSSGMTIFPNDTIGLAFYTTEGTSDFMGTGTYTFAVPEPSTALLLTGFGALLSCKRRGGRRQD